MAKFFKSQLETSLEDHAIHTIPVVVLDVETTGLYTHLGERIIEIGAIRYENWKPIGQFSQLINPQCPVSAKSTELTGLTAKDLADKPTFPEIKDALLDFVDGALMVAHNAKFDASFVNYELFISGLPQTLHPETDAPILTNPWLCTLQFARNYFHFSRNNLATVARHLNVRIGQTHRAMQDVYLTAEVCRRMVQQLQKEQNWDTVGDYLHAQGGAIYPNPLDFPSWLPDEISQAMEKQETLTITYLDKDGSETERTITPRFPTHYRNTDYVVAHCHLRNSQRTFRLDRILGVK